MITEADFRKQVKEVLEHLYDTAYLASHPLLSQLTVTTNTSPLARAQKLRRLLKESIEATQPQADLPPTAPEWRSYLALRQRYVLGMSLAQVEAELGISLRQLQREIHKGLDALVILLLENRVPDSQAERTWPQAGEVQELRNEMEQWHLSREVCEVQTLLEAALWILKPLVPQALNLRIELPAELPPVLADSTLLRQALFQILRLLIQNSDGSEIKIQAQAEGSQIKITMPGAPTAINQTATDWQKAELLIERQGGRLSVTGDSSVEIRLPQASPSFVLVVDDNQAIHDLIERYLTPHHYHILHAHSGVEALRLAEERQPNIILLDVMMPSVDGWEVLRRLNDNPATAGVPVVICSVLAEPELALSLGARAYLKKPAERLELLATLARIQNESAPAVANLPSKPSDN